MSEIRFNLGPYSHIIIDVTDAFYDEDTGTMQRRKSHDVTEEVTVRAEQLQEWFDTQKSQGQPPERQQEPYVGPDGDPGPQDEYGGQSAPQQRQETPRYGAGSGVETREQMLKRSWGDCPGCGAESRPSKEQYQEWEKTDDGIDVPAKHFCTNQNCPRPKKGLWRRELVEPNPGF